MLEEDMNKQGELNFIINEAKADYQTIAEEPIKDLPWVKFRSKVREAIYEIADDIKKGE